MNDEIAQLSIRGISVYSEQNYPLRIIKESLSRDHFLDLAEVHPQIVVPSIDLPLKTLATYVSRDNTRDHLGHRYL